MSKYYYFIISISLLALLFSCQPHEKSISSTYTIKVSDFEDFLTIDGFVEPVNTTTIGCPREADGVVAFIIDDGTYVNQGDVVCIVEDKELKKRYDEDLVNLENVKAELLKNKADLDMQYALLEAQVKNNAAETDIANLDTLQLKYLSTTQRKIKELELEKVAIEKQKLEKKLKSLNIINQSELRKSAFQIQRITNNVDGSKDRLDALTIKAPQAGLLTRATHFTGKKIQVGDPVWGNMPLVSIPDLKKMKAKIFASEGNYKRINVNDAVEFSYDAIPKNRSWGKILTKSPVGQPIKENSKIKVFEIEASIDSSMVIPGPGLTTNCKIVLKRIKDTLVIPQITIFDQDSMKVVYVKKSDKYEMRQILTGTSSQKSAVVIVGLRKNEIISFVKPGAALIVKKTLLPKSTMKRYKNKTTNQINNSN